MDVIASGTVSALHVTATVEGLSVTARARSTRRAMRNVTSVMSANRASKPRKHTHAAKIVSSRRRRRVRSPPPVRRPKGVPKRVPRKKALREASARVAIGVDVGDEVAAVGAKRRAHRTAKAAIALPHKPAVRRRELARKART